MNKTKLLDLIQNAFLAGSILIVLGGSGYEIASLSLLLVYILINLTRTDKRNSVVIDTTRTDSPDPKGILRAIFIGIFIFVLMICILLYFANKS